MPPGATETAHFPSLFTCQTEKLFRPCHRMANVSLYYIELKENFPLKQKQTCQHPRGEYSWEFLVRVCRPVLQTLTLFPTKKCNFPHPFSDKTSKIHTHFQTWLFRQKFCYHYLD